MRLDQSCNLPLGVRDALHVPFVVARAAEVSLEDRRDRGFQLKPRSFVKFTDDKFTMFAVCEQSEAQGILNPFLEEISYHENVVVLLMPGITTPVRHHFDIDLRSKEVERSILEEELEAAKASDPGCAGCYEIRNNSVIRN